MHINIILLFITIVISKSNLFAGNGLKVNTYTMYNGIIQFNCTTYNDCYNLLCMPMMPDDYLITIKPNYWNGNCSTLNNNTTPLISQINTYTNNQYNSYNTSTLSDMSKLLCILNKNTNITRIEYYGFGC